MSEIDGWAAQHVRQCVVSVPCNRCNIFMIFFYFDSFTCSFTSIIGTFRSIRRRCRRHRRN